MEKLTAIDTVRYRSKGPEGTRPNCAIRFSEPLLKLMGDPERVSVIVMEPDNRNHRWELHIRAHPQGYKVNFKPGSKIGEISVAWAELSAACPTVDGKGTLPCTLARDVLIVDISTWVQAQPVQDTLFPSWGKVLLP